jgi:hypothetical protein
VYCCLWSETKADFVHRSRRKLQASEMSGLQKVRTNVGGNPSEGRYGQFCNLILVIVFFLNVFESPQALTKVGLADAT